MSFHRLVCLIVVIAILPQTNASGKTPASLNQLSTSLSDLATHVSPAVVQIFTTQYEATLGGYLDSAEGLGTQHSGGSGVILDPDGYIITNAHVVRNARRVQVMLNAPLPSESPSHSILKPRGRLIGASVVRTDPETDLAVLKIAATDLPHLELGDSDALQQGQLVLAFGSPLGLANSVSLGVVSAQARQLRPEDPMIYIQTDAAINPGNSGGPLVNATGQVVGINTFIFSQSGGDEGIGFAAPSNIVRTVFEQIRDTGRIRRGIIGVQVQTITPILAAGLNLPRDWGVIVNDVLPGGPAQRAGIEPGDIVLRLDGKTMENGRQFNVNLYGRHIGEKVSIETLRQGETIHFTVDVIERANDPARFADLVDPQRNLIPKLGILGLEVDARIARLLPKLRRRNAVIVAARAPEAPYWEGNFELGDAIYAVNGTSVHTLPGLRQVVDKLESGMPVVIQIERNRRLLYIAFQL